MTITIRRTEIEMITRNRVPIDTRAFDGRETAAEFLREQVPYVTDDNLEEIFTHETTNFQVNEFVNRGTAAYSTTVEYDIEVNGNP